MKLPKFLSKLFGSRRHTSAPSSRIVYALPDITVYKKYYNQDTFFDDIDWSDWSAVIDGFQARFERWYFANMNGGHSSYLDFCALCALVEVFCYYELEKDWHEPKNYKEFLRKLDSVFRTQLGSPIPITRYEGGRWTSAKLKDFADVFYAGVRCSLHHHGDLASFAGMSGTGKLAIEKLPPENLYVAPISIRWSSLIRTNLRLPLAPQTHKKQLDSETSLRPISNPDT